MLTAGSPDRLPHPSAYLQGFDTMCLHAGYNPVGDDAVYGLGQGAPRGVPLHRTAPYQVRPRFRVVTPRDRDSESPISSSLSTLGPTERRDVR